MYAYICTQSKSQISEALRISRTKYLWAIEQREANFSGKLYSILLHVLQDLAMLDLCSGGAWVNSSLVQHWRV